MTVIKKRAKEPRMLREVLEAIASLKERQGSTQKQIVKYISDWTSSTGAPDTDKNIGLQVFKALEHGLKMGLLKQNRGKFSLGLECQKYANLRKLKGLRDPPPSDCNSCRRHARRVPRRRKSRRARRRRPRRRRKSTVSEDDDEEQKYQTEDSESTFGTPEPKDRGRRRGRKKRRRSRSKGRRRRRRNRSRLGDSQSPDGGEPKAGGSETQQENRHRAEKDNSKDAKQRNNSNQQGRQGSQEDKEQYEDHNQDLEEADAIDCGNPDCLCNVRHDDQMPDYCDSYIN